MTIIKNTFWVEIFVKCYTLPGSFHQTELNRHLDTGVILKISNGTALSKKG